MTMIRELLAAAIGSLVPAPTHLAGLQRSTKSSRRRRWTGATTSLRELQDRRAGERNRPAPAESVDDRYSPAASGPGRLWSVYINGEVTGDAAIRETLDRSTSCTIIEAYPKDLETCADSDDVIAHPRPR